MANSVENLEIIKFHQSLLQEITLIQLSDEEGGNQEQIFTQIVVDLLAEGGETENVRVAYDEKALGTKSQHKINAYSISDNYETVDLFVTIFKGTPEIERILKDDIETASKRISNFFKKGIYKDYVNEIEESSPIFQLAHTLSNSVDLKENLVRVNAIILTDGLYPGEIPSSHVVSDYPITYRVIDVNYLYNISEKSHIPIEIDFKSDGFEVPCIISPSENVEYQSYLAIIPGAALVSIYERFGSRLLEQNVRSFLQFSGKINKGIRTTILKEPHMFLAYNNGIAATAEEIELATSSDNKSLVISKVKDFQIVNGGQTTASIYHTYKKDKADISGIFVQVKLNVVKNKENFSTIVSDISQYANTQNKVSVSDLSANRPYHIEIEKLSRSIVTPHIPGKTTQTNWFYERARGQYKNARIKEGFTKSRQAAFDLKNPKNKMFTKEDLAKYVNAYSEVTDGKKIWIGPNIVVRGNQKNYVQFMSNNLVKAPDSIYYEDVIAKAILFRAAETAYGIKPNSIGDMRYVTVPYAISYLSYKTKCKLDLYKIWKNQSISLQLEDLLYPLMVKIESFIKSNAPGSLYGEWAKKEECWIDVRKQDFGIDFTQINKDLEDPKNATQRRKITDEETVQRQINEETSRLKSIPASVWKKIEGWGKATGLLSTQKMDVAYNIALRNMNNFKVSDYERISGMQIIDIVIENAPEILFEIDDLILEDASGNTDSHNSVTEELIEKIVKWDKKNKRLKDFEYIFMAEIAEGKKTLTEKNKKIAFWNFQKVKKYGFKVD
jgi:hypothetical protein